MKRIVSLLFFTLMFITMIFSESYEELLAKGKLCEGKKEYVYALGYYYDAMNSESDNSGEGEEKFNSIAEKLRRGVDGLELSMWDDPKEAWNKIIKEYHKYFTEFSPYEFFYGNKLQQGELNYKNKTASYTMTCYSKLSEKFMEISKILSNSINLNEQDGELRNNWYSCEDKKVINSGDFYRERISSYGIEPYSSDTSGAVYSVSYGTGGKSKYLITLIPYMRFVFENLDKTKAWERYSAATFSDVQQEKILATYLSEFNKEILNYYKQTGIALSVVTDWFEDAAYMATFVSFEDKSQFRIERWDTGFVTREISFLPYSLQFGIYNNENKLLVTGDRQCVSSNLDDEKNQYVFSNIPESVMRIVEKGEYTIRPIGAWLNYGVIRRMDVENKIPSDLLWKKYLKNAAEIRQSLEKISIINLEDQYEKLRKEHNYDVNCENLSVIIGSYLKNSEKLGFKFDNEFNVTAVSKNSPAQKAGLKIGMKLDVPWSRIEQFSDQSIVDVLKLKNRFREEILDQNELKSYVKQTLGNEIAVFVNFILPLEPGSSITFTVISGKKSKDVTLTVPY